MKKAVSEISESSSKKKGKLYLVLIIVALLLLAIGIVIFFVSRSNSERKEREKQEELERVYEQQTTGYAIDNYLECLNTSDLERLGDTSVILDSVVLNEFDVANNDMDVLSFITNICSLVEISGQDYDSKVEGFKDESEYDITIVDYKDIESQLDSDKVLELMLSEGLSLDDLDLPLRLPSIFCKYILSLESIPTMEVEIPLTVKRVDAPLGDSPYYCVLESDSVIDDLLFGSEDFHSLLDSFAKVVVGWTGSKLEYYTVSEEQVNPEYTDWVSKLNEQIEKFPTWKSSKTCLYEPFYLRDEKNKIVKDENGNKVVNFYVLFEADEKGRKIKDNSSPYKYKYIPEPPKTVMVDVQRVRQVEDPWVSGLTLPFNWVGYNYIVSNDLPIRSGDGSREFPLGLDTWKITKLTLHEGSSIDAKISMKGYYVGEEAVKYALSLSEKNRGLDSSSVVQLVICEFEISNLSDMPVVFKPDMVLVDEYGSKLSRTGTLYGVEDSISLGAGETIRVVDWCTSTDLLRYQAAWGRSYDVDTDLMYFNVVKSN